LRPRSRPPLVHVSALRRERGFGRLESAAP
jgi:hypothetical protein